MIGLKIKINLVRTRIREWREADPDMVRRRVTQLDNKVGHRQADQNSQKIEKS